MKTRLNKFTFFLFIIFVFTIIIYSFVIDLKNVSKYMSNDLRSRVVASRLLNENIDPYFKKWEPGDKLIYIDPRDFPSRPVSRVTTPPTVLFFQSITINFTYRTQKYISLFSQWFALIVTIFLLTNDINQSRKKVTISLSILMIFSVSWFWRFHVDAGQLYVFYTMLFSFSYFLMKNKNNSNVFEAGLVIGFLSAFRPNAIVFCSPQIVLKNFNFMKGMLIGFVTNILLSIYIWGISPWIKYLKAINIHGKIHQGILKFDYITNSMEYRINNVEGVKYFDDLPRFIYTDSSLQILTRLNSRYLILLFMVIMIIYTVFLFQNRKNIDTVDSIFFSGITAVIISEFFIPAARLAYYDVIWILPLCLAIKNALNNKKIVFDILLILAGILMLLFAEKYIPLGFIGPYITLISTVHISTIYIRGLYDRKLL